MNNFLSFLADNLAYVLIFAGLIIVLGVIILTLCLKKTNQDKKDNNQVEENVIPEGCEVKSIKNTTQEVEEEKEIKVANDDNVKDEEEVKEDAKEEVKHEVYRVKYDKMKGDWVVKKDGATRAYRRFATKEEASKFAKTLTKEKGLVVSVHKKNGKFQKQK